MPLYSNLVPKKESIEFQGKKKKEGAYKPNGFLLSDMNIG